ncbi:hypothetical protein HNP99_001162 [Flavobacterium sp. 28A]|uniref:GIY-YIG nuclease family protein n=1 Tax=Flavobacterium sp. 28A TaxID=2735895 RepID=UPI00156F05E5|nr:GIY-YIG nuclease family protein [Flavobacterium sp. 28A]NRT14818.1 hypothetical protein [Flavobacterium sp. 28A]
MEKNFINKPRIEIDDFGKSTKITWSVVGGHLYPYCQNMPSPIGGIVSNSDTGKDLVFSFENHDCKDFLIFYVSPSKTYNLCVSDKVFFMFDNEIIISFEITNEKERSRYESFNKIRIQITQNELEIFAYNKLLKWKIESFKKNNSIISVAKNFYWYKNENYATVVQNLAKDYKELVKQNINNYLPLLMRNNDNNRNVIYKEECYVYLMIDTTNNFHKIGISNNPKYREKTLQSDKPTIELVCSKSFPNRKTAQFLEKTLHKVYDHNRVRGEWFRLDYSEVQEVIITLK